MDNPHLGQIIPDKYITCHGRGGFSAPAGRGTGKPGKAIPGAMDARDKHMLGRFRPSL